MPERLPAWLKNKWVLFGLSCAATLVIGALIFLIFLRGAFATMLTNQGQKALNAQDFSKAANKYSTALTLKKNREAIYIGCGSAMIGLEDYDGAVAVLEKGIDRISGSEELYLCKVQALVAAGKIGKAVDFLDNISDSYINKKIQAARPADLTFSPSQGKYGKTQKVTIDLREGETVYYTLNGEDPTMASAVYKEPITVSTTATLTAIAVSGDGLVSPRLRLTYEIDNANESVEFADAKMEAMVRLALNRPSGSIYAAQLLSVTDLSSDLVEGSIRSLKDLEYMPSLNSLRIVDELLIEDYTPLAGLTELELLTLSGCALSDGDLANIGGLTKLTELCIDHNQITSLQSLHSLTKLEYLSVNDNDLESTSTLSGFSKLKWLYLAENRILTLDGLTELSDLLTLELSGNYISDLSPLTGLKRLTDLYLRNNTPKNIKKLSALPALTHLDISGCGLASLSVVNDFQALQSLVAEDNQIASLSTFNRQISELYINRNPLVDLSPLKGQQALVALEASDTQIQDISFLAGSKTLLSLDISNTEVTDATCLKDCTALSYLVCSERCSTAGLPATVEVIIK